jgi:hypothetical protein
VLFAATHPSRTTALVVLEGYPDPMAEQIEGGADPGNHRRLHGASLCQEVAVREL